MKSRLCSVSTTAARDAGILLNSFSRVPFRSASWFTISSETATACAVWQERLALLVAGRSRLCGGNVGCTPPFMGDPEGDTTMPAPDSLKEVYADEMKDLWSANDQMTRAVKSMAGKAHDPKLKEALETAVTGIGKHAETLKSLLQDAGAEVEKEHCAGMEGLVKEALKHTTKEAPKEAELLDIEIIAQYQRMSHYGIAGFGSAAAYAGALGMKEHVAKLKAIVSDIYKGDEFASELGKKAAAHAAKKAA